MVPSVVGLVVFAIGYGPAVASTPAVDHALIRMLEIVAGGLEVLFHFLDGALQQYVRGRPSSLREAMIAARRLALVIVADAAATLERPRRNVTRRIVHGTPVAIALIPRDGRPVPMERYLAVLDGLLALV